MVCLVPLTRLHTSVPPTGVHALAAAIFHEAGDLSKSEQHLQQLMSYLPHALHSSAADEILYGRAGFLFCLLFARKHLGQELCEQFGVTAATRKVFDAIVKSGKDNSSSRTRFVSISSQYLTPHSLNTTVSTSRL